MRRRKFRPAPSAARPTGPTTRSRRSASRTTSWRVKALSESTIAAFTRQLFAVRQSLMTEFPLAAKIETPDTDKDAAIPVHPGAAAFIDGEEKTFLDRYSDFIWWGLMGAVGDGLGRRLVRGLSEEGRAQQQHLAARPAAGHAGGRRAAAIRPNELDQMQSEADDILRQTLLLLRARRDRAGTLDRLQYRARAIPQRGGRPQGIADEHAAEPAKGRRAVPGHRNR